MTGYPIDATAEVKQLAIKLDEFKTRVDAINIDGVARTKDDVLVPMVRQLFEANNFEEVVVRAHTVRRQLEQLGAFKSIGVFIDTSTGDNSSLDGLEVTYSVVENRRVVGGVNTSIGNNNDGSLVLQLKCPNLFGRGLYATSPDGTTAYGLTRVRVGLGVGSLNTLRVGEVTYQVSVLSLEGGGVGVVGVQSSAPNNPLLS